VLVSGNPPASEITSGWAVTAIRSRIADDFIVCVRRAEQPGVALEVAGRGSGCAHPATFAAAGRAPWRLVYRHAPGTLARMDFVLDLLQGAGIAAGDRHPPVPAGRCSSARSRGRLGSTSTAPTSRSSSRPFLLACVVLRRALDLAAARAGATDGRRGYALGGSRRARRARWRPARSPTTARLVARADRRRRCARARLRRRALAVRRVAPRLDPRPPARCRSTPRARLLAAGLSILFPPLAVLVIGGPARP
jgi:hypothetical protein